MIRDKIVVEVRDEKLSEKIKLDADLTLEKAVTQAKQKEAVHGQQAIVRNMPVEDNLDTIFQKKQSSTSWNKPNKPR